MLKAFCWPETSIKLSDAKFTRSNGQENNSTTNLKFHRGGRFFQCPAISPFSSHIPSKWNDAEKWIVNRQAVQENGLKKNLMQHQCNRLMNSSWTRIAPESMIAEQKPSSSSISTSNPHNLAEKFSFVSEDFHSSSDSSNDKNCPAIPPQSRNGDITTLENLSASGMPDRQLVSMRNVGTEMTPTPSQEPSRTGTPIENLTPSRSPISSIPSSPGRKLVTMDIIPAANEDEKDFEKGGNILELSERELQMKTRREIAALGLQLGKLNIASWACKETETKLPFPKAADEKEQLMQEYEVRSAAWEEAEKSKHMARYRREEIKILAWETHQRAKYEARMRRVENRATMLRSHAEAAMAEKLQVMEKRAEEKRANAEAIMSLQAARTTQQADQIRRSGRVPSRSHCCNWFL